MKLVEAIGYFATGMNIAGNLMLAKMNISGWIVRLLTNVVYVIYAVQVVDGGPIVINHIIFFAINVYGFWQWKKQVVST